MKSTRSLNLLASTPTASVIAVGLSLFSAPAWLGAQEAAPSSPAPAPAVIESVTAPVEAPKPEATAPKTTEATATALLEPTEEELKAAEAAITAAAGEPVGAGVLDSAVGVAQDFALRSAEMRSRQRLRDAINIAQQSPQLQAIADRISATNSPEEARLARLEYAEALSKALQKQVPDLGSRIDAAVTSLVARSSFTKVRSDEEVASE